MIAKAAREAVADRGVFTLAISGGRSPWRMYAGLADLEMPWAQTELFQVDERVAPPGDPDRNWERALEALPIPRLRAAHPMPVTAADLDAAAASYEALLPSSLDLVHLGLGPDGHTASLVPGDPVLEVRDRRVAPTAAPYQGRRRMTLTYPGLASARRLLWLVIGDDKREALRLLRAGDRTIPAARVATVGASVLVADAAAASTIP